MKCWTCQQPVVSKHLCYRLPTGSLQWLYGCRACQTTYTAQYNNVTGRLGMLVVHAIPKEQQATLLLGEIVVSERDPITEAERTGEMILRN
jgi:hypothetical protein